MSTDKPHSTQVHNGFQSAYTSVMKPIGTTLQGLLCEEGWRFVVTGHSLGGGIASIAATSFAGMGFQVSEVVTFGEPRNGDAAWAKHYSTVISDDHYYRVTHSSDGVPQIPPTVLGYAHHSPEYFQSQQTNNSAETTLKCETDSPVRRSLAGSPSWVRWSCICFTRLTRLRPEM